MKIYRNEKNHEYGEFLGYRYMLNKNIISWDCLIYQKGSLFSERIGIAFSRKSARDKCTKYLSDIHFADNFKDN
jgi:hypothetical protein